jgi:hypothetical protein
MEFKRIVPGWDRVGRARFLDNFVEPHSETFAHVPGLMVSSLAPSKPALSTSDISSRPPYRVLSRPRGVGVR